MFRPKAHHVLLSSECPAASARVKPARGVLLALGCALLWALPVAPAKAVEVVQALPDPNTARLGDALTRLAHDQNDLEALLDAGNAARELGDFEAARRFFERARRVAPGDGRIAAGQARTALLSGDPVGAIAYFEEAERAGVDRAGLASDHGLALDMAGDNLDAQRFYRSALGAGDDAQVRQRLAVSQAISGDLEASEQTLMPLLRKQDKPAWRTRAFTLAIAGETKEAIKLAERILPEGLADQVAPYMRYMPRLTAAQQAAAANLGRFPRASEVGRDSAKIAAYKPERTAAGADSRLIPSGQPLDTPSQPDRGEASADGTAAQAGRARGRSLRLGQRNLPESASQRAERRRQEEKEKERAARARKSVREADNERVAPPDPKPGIEVKPGDGGPALSGTGELPPVSASASAAARSQMARLAPTPVPTATPTPTPAPAPAATPAKPQDAASKAGEAPAASGPGFDLGRLMAASGTAPMSGGAASRPATASVSPPASAPSATPAPAMSLSEAFSDLGKPREADRPVSGAVDMRKVTPARPAPPPPPPKPKKPAHPSRIWVQIGVGRDTKAIAFDWHRHERRDPELFKGQSAHVTEMGRTNRILVGPFATQKAAKDFAGDYAKAGNGTALVWTSPAGQVIDELDTKG